MKKIMHGAALAAALMAPGLASANTSGAIEVSYEDNDFDYGDFWDLQLGAAVMQDMGGWMLQGEGRATMQDWDNDWRYGHGVAAVHGSMDFGGWDGGIYTGILNYYGDGGLIIGLEGRTAFGNLSLDGSIGHASMADDNYDGTQVRVGGAYFFTPNLAINAGASQTDIESSGGADWEITELSLGAAYQFANNVTLFGGYTNTDGENGADYEGDTINIGLRLNFNGGTLQDNTNDGLWQAAQHLANTFKRW